MTLPLAMVLVKPKFFFGIPSGFTRLFERVKNTKMVHFVLMPDVCHPLVDVRGKSYTSDATGVGGVLLLVQCIQKFWHISKIAPSVVRTVSVDMVNLTLGRRAGHKQKSQPVRLVHFVCDGHHGVTLGINGTSNSTGIFGVPDAASNLGCHVSLSVLKHVWRGSLVGKCASVWAVGNPLKWVTDLHAKLLCSSMNKYSSSANQFKGGLA